MLVSFGARNYRCIRQLRANLTFAEGKAPNGYKEFTFYPFLEQAGKRVIPVLALYGANASGKTTVLESLLTLRALVLKGWHQQFFRPNRLTKDAESQLRLSSNFVSEGKYFEYAIAYSANGIESELLRCNGEMLYFIESGRWNSGLSSFKEAFDSETFRNRALIAQTFRQIRTFLMVVAEEFPGLSAELNTAYGQFQSIVGVSGHVMPEDGLKVLSETFSGSEKEKQEQALKLISLYLHKFDFRVKRISCRRVSLDLHTVPEALREFIDDNPWHFFTYHQNEDGQEVSFDLAEESSGTINLVGLLGLILAALRTGKTVLVDELDSSLHPFLVREIVKMFKSKQINKNQAQLLFTLHNTDLLDSSLLSISEVGFVEQEGVQGTNIRRIADFEFSRNVDNFRKRYLKGAYRGVPYPYI